MSDFRKLDVWKKAHALALNVHRVAGSMRRREHAALRNQIVRAAMSVPANIAEGREQRSDKQFAKFLQVAMASCTELEYHLILASDIQAIGQRDFASLHAQVIDVRKMLTGLLKRLGSTGPKPSSNSVSKQEAV